MTTREIAAVTAFHDSFGLTAKEALVLLQMARGGIVEHRRIVGIYCDRPDTAEIEARSCIKRIRAKLRGTKLSITSHYGLGYELTAESARKLRQIERQAVAGITFLNEFRNREDASACQ